MKFTTTPENTFTNLEHAEQYKARWERLTGQPYVLVLGPISEDCETYTVWVIPATQADDARADGWEVVE